MNLIERLPNSFDPEMGERIPKQLLGATILRFGTFPRESNLRGGGLVIDYQRPHSTSVRRIIFEFDEQEMHVHSDEPTSDFSNSDGMPK